MTAPPKLRRLVQNEETEAFDTQLKRFRDGKVAEKVFTEFRLRHGTYGQRQEGVQMQRIKIPLGRVTLEQLRALADVAEEFADSILHVTTRQDIQVHFMQLDDAPEVFRRLDAVGITTREACGNAVRNVTSCVRAGVCPDESFDVDPYAQAVARYLLRHPDAQDFGRKFKISFSGCGGPSCGQAKMHDIGAVARIQEGQRGFELWVGGGLGAIPMPAKLFDPFVTVDELMPIVQAIVRVFARLGEKQARSRARMKFLLQKIGIDEFRRLVLEERAGLRPDPIWDVAVDDAKSDVAEKPTHPPALLEQKGDATLGAFLDQNVQPQSQAGYSIVTVLLRLGDLTADQMRGLADVAQRYIGDTVRFTVDQNIVLRWVPDARIPELFEDLRSLGLASVGATTMANVTACPGTDSCKLGITSSRGLAARLLQDFENGRAELGRRDDISVKISGCPNSCGQHHIANIGFAGSSKRKGDSVAPVFQVFLGGTGRDNAGTFGMAAGKVAASRAPEVVARLTEVYLSERENEEERFEVVMNRLGKRRIAEELAPFSEIPDRLSAPELYRDNRQSWDYVREIGVGECAGEIVSQAEFLLADAERFAFEATVAFEEGDATQASGRATDAMLAAADALLSTKGLLRSDGYDTVARFRQLFFENGGGFQKGFASYLFSAIGESGGLGDERVRHKVEEANLFVEEANVVYGKLAGDQVK